MTGKYRGDIEAFEAQSQKEQQHVDHGRAEADIVGNLAAGSDPRGAARHAREGRARQNPVGSRRPARRFSIHRLVR
jgi:hypothetical protein